MSWQGCTYHPSRDASAQCRSCGRRLCAACLQERGGVPYCSRWCWCRGLFRTAVAAARRVLALPIPPPWGIAATAIIAVPLMAGTGLLVARLLATAPPAATVLVRRQPTPQPTTLAAHIQGHGRQSRLLVYGTPGTTVLVTLDDRPWRVVGLDASGRAEVTLVLRGTPPRVRVFGLGTGVPATAVTPTATPTTAHLVLPTATVAAAATPVPTVTPVPTSIPTASHPHATPTPPPTPATRPSPVAMRSSQVPDLLLVRDGGPRLALTFDGGSTADGTAQLLALFRRLHLRPTLFVTGAFIRNHPALVRQAVLDGHEIGNHLLTHPHLTTYAKNRRQQLLPNVSRPWFEHQLLATERLFFEATGRRMAPLWRAPFGEENATLRSWAYDLGYLHVRWSSLRGTSLDSRDWVDDEHSSLFENSDRMMKRLLGFPHLEGGIVLMHLSTHRSQPPWKVLPELVAKLHARGIQLGSVSSLLQASPSWRPHLETARKRFEARQARQGSHAPTEISPVAADRE